MPANSILIADDDEKLLSVLLSYFKDEQFTVYLARDGGEASSASRKIIPISWSLTS